MSDGDPSPFFTRPISAGFAILIALTILASVPPVRRALAGLKPKRPQTDKS